MELMAVLAVLMAIGVGLTLWWGAAGYRIWRPGRTDAGRPPSEVPSVADAARIYARGVAIALVAGFWAGALVTGPAVRLVMRLLAVTSGPEAQGRLTEAEEVIGQIDFSGTLGLYLFGGILPGLLSGGVYVLTRRWLPAGRAGGVVFGLFHLALLATRIDPLRPDNEDFALVGPGWLSVVTYGLTAILHGMAVAAFANRYSAWFPPGPAKEQGISRRVLTVAALVPPLILLIPGAFLLAPIGAGLVFSLGFLRLPHTSQLQRSPRVTRVGRILAVGVAGVFLPFTVMDLASIFTEPRITTPLPPRGAGR